MARRRTGWRAWLACLLLASCQLPDLDAALEDLPEDPPPAGCTVDADCAGMGAAGADWTCVKTTAEAAEGFCVSAAPDPGCVPTDEVCDGVDNDCDEVVDNGVQNACGGCGAVPTEVCNGADDDCDGQTDEQAADLNACGECGAAPAETCDGTDEDCDGAVDEGFDAGAPCGVGACGGGQKICNEDGAGTHCSTAALATDETCNGMDDNCDGQIDEGIVYQDPLHLGNLKEVGARCTGLGVCGGGIVICADDGTACCSWDPACGAPALNEEICDGVDNDCDGEVDEDATDFNSCGVCAPEPIELCNGIDDNCDQVVDEAWINPDGPGEGEGEGEDDGDEDGGPYLADACVVGLGVCEGAGRYGCNEAGDGIVCVGEIDDEDQGDEVCDGADNDCDGEVDEGLGLGDDCTSGLGECLATGVQVCGDNDDVVCNAEPAEGNDDELCDGLDDDCDGEVDNGFEVGGDCGVGACEGGLWECDGEGDRRCTTAGQAAEVESCNGIDDDCDGVIPPNEGDVDEDGALDCEELIACGVDAFDDRTVAPGAPELCDGVDNDCDGQVDEDFVGLGDGCGFGRCAGTLVCDVDDLLSRNLICDGLGPRPEVCNGVDDDCDGLLPVEELDLDDDGFAGCEGDCNDLSELVSPAIEERCNGIDDNCDGEVPADEADGDGDRWLICDGDCADDDPTTYPGATQLCDGVDNTCSDDFDASTEEDEDEDDFLACEDCNDDDELTYPGAPERCDGLDNNCNGLPDEFEPEVCNGIDDNCNDEVDEGFDVGAECTGDEGLCSFFRGEIECDGPEDTICSADPGGSDTQARAEECNGVDDDCDDEVDEGCDKDGDGWCDEQLESDEEVRICNPGDCSDDVDADPDAFSINPDAEEVCDGVDNNCDGEWFVAPPRTEDGGPDEGSCADGVDNDNDNAVDCDDSDCAETVVCGGPGNGGDDEDRDEDGHLTCSEEPDCDDDEPATYPGADEACDGQDNDCDGAVPEDEVDSDDDGLLDCEDCSPEDEDIPRANGIETIGNGADDTCDGFTDSFFDDFDDEDLARPWTRLVPSVVEADGVLTLSSEPGVASVAQVLAPATGDTWEVTTRLWFPDGNEGDGLAGVMYAWSGDSFGFAAISPPESVVIGTLEGDFSIDVAAQNDGPLPGGGLGPMELRVRADQEGVVEVWIDGVSVARAEGLRTGGRPGLVATSTTATFDDFQVTP
jgi:hypothetical protein